jgi:predicted molibdopterin-dependent oxidoreductase YjgC
MPKRATLIKNWIISRGCTHCDFIVLKEIFPSETAPYADVLLPGASFAEKTGTFTNTERRIQMVHKAAKPIGEGYADWRIITELSRRILENGERKVSSGEYTSWDYESASQIMDEVAALTPINTGVSHARLDGGERLL